MMLPPISSRHLPATPFTGAGVLYSWGVFGLFCLGFGLLFLTFPLNGSLTGKLDTYYYLAVFNDYLETIKAYFTGQPYGIAMYPTGKLHAFGEPLYGTGAVFMGLRLFFNNLWAWYLLIVLLYASTGTGMFRLAYSYLGSLLPALLAAVAFSAGSFMLGNLEGVNNLAFFPAFTSIYFFRKWLHLKQNRSLWVAMIWGGAQVYFSTYIFLLMVLVLGALLLRHMLRGNVPSPAKLILAAIIFLAVSLPFVFTINQNSLLLKSANRIDTFNDPHVSLQFRDLALTLENNIIYPRISYDPPLDILMDLHSAFPGAVVVLLSVIGIFYWRKRSVVWLIIGAVGLLIALGPYWYLSETRIPSPTHWLFSLLESKVFRIPIRAYFLTGITLALLAGAGAYVIQQRSRYGKILVMLLIVLTAAEHVPYKFTLFHNAGLIHPPQALLDHLKPYPAGKTVLLTLPMAIQGGNGVTPVDNLDYANEYIYHLWQHEHKLNILNGSSGFTPPHRLRLEEFSSAITTPEMVDSMVNTFKPDVISFQKYMAAQDETEQRLNALRHANTLQLQVETDSIAIFTRRRP